MMSIAGFGRVGRAALAAAALATVGCGGGDSQPFSSDIGRFRVAFPAGFPRPQGFVRSRRHDGRRLEIFSFVSQSSSGAALIGYCDLPEGVAEPSLDDVCRDGPLALDGKVAVAAGPADQAGTRDYTFILPSRVSPPVGRGRTILKDCRLFHFIFLAPTESDLKRAEVEAFFNSVRILPPPKTAEPYSPPALEKTDAPPEAPGAGDADAVGGAR